MDNAKSSADLEREVDEQRNRVEARIGELRDRLSPGQLLDEALSYSRDGGANFASNFAQQVSANPIPAALVGVGLAWLMGSNLTPTPAPAANRSNWRDSGDEYPYARVPSGGLRRTAHAADEAGDWWSEFQTDTGETFKARAGEAGERAGHFTDEAGRRFSGFIDDAGNRVQQFQDEAGNRLDDALGWTSHNWSAAQSKVGETMSAIADGARDAGNRLAQSTGTLSSTLQAQSSQIGRQLVDVFNQQPLVAGALAFAAGAAVGALLPTTSQEDALLGEQSDRVKGQAADAVGELYEKGKEQVQQAYASATDTGAKVYETAKEQLKTTGASAGSLS